MLGRREFLELTALSGVDASASPSSTAEQAYEFTPRQTTSTPLIALLPAEEGFIAVSSGAEDTDMESDRLSPTLHGFDTDGGRRWQWTHNFTGEIVATDAVRMGDSILVVGKASRETWEGKRVVLFRLDADRRVVWTSTLHSKLPIASGPAVETVPGSETAILAWVAATPSEERSTLAAVGGTGTVRWRKNVPLTEPPTIAAGEAGVLIAQPDGVSSYDVDGSTHWSFASDSLRVGAVTATDRGVVVAPGLTDSGIRLHSYRTTGERMWSQTYRVPAGDAVVRGVTSDSRGFTIRASVMDTYPPRRQVLLRTDKNGRYRWHVTGPRIGDEQTEPRSRSRAYAHLRLDEDRFAVAGYMEVESSPPVGWLSFVVPDVSKTTNPAARTSTSLTTTDSATTGTFGASTTDTTVPGFGVSTSAVALRLAAKAFQEWDR